MNRKRLKLIENMIIVTFPLVLFAGCAGSDIKPTNQEPPTATYSDYDSPQLETDMTNQSTAFEIQNDVKLSVVEQTSLEHAVDSHQDFVEEPEDDTGIQLTDSTQTETQASSSTLDLPSENILMFDTDEYKLLHDQQTVLEQHAQFLIANPEITLVINGHADARGTESYNQSLSEKRAKSVYETLVGLGVPKNQLKKFGFGEHFPQYDVNNWNENRRVELEFSNPVLVSSSQ